jgi:hypothetical protein
MASTLGYRHGARILTGVEIIDVFGLVLRAALSPPLCRPRRARIARQLLALNHMRFSGWVRFAKTPDIGIERRGQSRIDGSIPSRHLAT